MTYHVIACGQTAQHWNGEGPSIGVNDAAKWGHPLDNLILVNAPNQFQSSRLDVILKTKSKIWSSMPEFWDMHFSNIHRMTLRKWTTGEKAKRGSGIIHHSNTSPFVALSMAYDMGASKIVLWGVDLINHPNYGKNTKSHINEMMKFASYINAIKAEGVEVFIGENGTAFDNLLPTFI
jgi:hypothetical protein